MRRPAPSGSVCGVRPSQPSILTSAAVSASLWRWSMARSFSARAALMEMSVQGVSTRRMKAITKELCGLEFNASAVRGAVAHRCRAGPAPEDQSHPKCGLDATPTLLRPSFLIAPSPSRPSSAPATDLTSAIARTTPPDLRPPSPASAREAPPVPMTGPLRPAAESNARGPWGFAFACEPVALPRRSWLALPGRPVKGSQHLSRLLGQVGRLRPPSVCGHPSEFKLRLTNVGAHAPAPAPYPGNTRKSLLPHPTYRRSTFTELDGHNSVQQLSASAQKLSLVSLGATRARFPCPL